VSVYDKIGEFLLTLRFKYGVEEFSDTSELANFLAEMKPGEEATALLSLPGRPRPILVSAYREGDAFALALVDLDDVRSADLKVELGSLEDVTSRIGAEKFGDRGLAPFFFPIMERDGQIYFAMGVKTVLDAVTGGVIDQLIETLEWEGDTYYKEILKSLQASAP
jgi:hypothetical protein